MANELDSIKLARRLLVRHIKECVAPHLHDSGYVDGRDRKNRSVLGMFSAKPLRLVCVRPVSLASEGKCDVIGENWISTDSEGGGLATTHFDLLMIDDLTIIAIHVSNKDVFTKQKKR